MKKLTILQFILIVNISFSQVLRPYIGLSYDISSNRATLDFNKKPYDLSFDNHTDFVLGAEYIFKNNIFVGIAYRTKYVLSTLTINSFPEYAPSTIRLRSSVETKLVSFPVYAGYNFRFIKNKDYFIAPNVGFAYASLGYSILGLNGSIANNGSARELILSGTSEMPNFESKSIPVLNLGLMINPLPKDIGLRLSFNYTHGFNNSLPIHYFTQTINEPAVNSKDVYTVGHTFSSNFYSLELNWGYRFKFKKRK
jgi:hypothetical protein